MPASILFEVRPGYSVDDVLAEVPGMELESVAARPAFSAGGTIAIHTLRAGARELHAARMAALAAAGPGPGLTTFTFRQRTFAVSRDAVTAFRPRPAEDLFGGAFNPANVWKFPIEPRAAPGVRAALSQRPGVAAVGDPGTIHPACVVGGQDYLKDSANLGMNVEAAHGKMAGLGFGLGSGVALAVADVGFPEPTPGKFQHGDIDGGAVMPIEGTNSADLARQGHGLMTLSGLFGTHAQVKGIVPKATRTLRVIPGGGPEALADAIARAAVSAGPGGVLLVEFELLRLAPDVPTYDTDGLAPTLGVPVYLDRLVREVIHAAALFGVLVVVPSGNAPVDLIRAEAAEAAGGVSMEVPMLLVGGVLPSRLLGGGQCEHRRAARCGRGPRVDCYGWFESVAVVRKDQTGVDAWGGTSAASAMVAGAATLTASFYAQKYGVFLDSYQLRAVMRDRSLGERALALVPDPAPGTGMSDQLTADVVGVMPDLARIFDVLETAQMAPSGLAPGGDSSGLKKFFVGEESDVAKVVTPGFSVVSAGVSSLTTAGPASDIPGGSRCFRAPRLRKPQLARPRLRWPCRR